VFQNALLIARERLEAAAAAAAANLGLALDFINSERRITPRD